MSTSTIVVERHHLVGTENTDVLNICVHYPGYLNQIVKSVQVFIKSTDTIPVSILEDLQHG